MPITTLFRFKNHALMMALAAAYPAFCYAAGAATLDFAAGSVTSVGPAGNQRNVAKGAEIGSGESVVTGDGGRAQLRFSDGGMVSLQPGSEFKIDSYHFSGNEDGEEKGFFSLLKGGLRSITGLVGRTNKNAYKVTTNVATIGIRGTEFTIAYTGASSISVSTGEGTIEVCNSVGCAIVPAGSSAVVSGPSSVIQRTEIKPRLDPMQPLPDVRPVFATSEARSGNGLVAPVSPPLVSGPNYAMTWAGDVSGSTSYGANGTGTATFDANSLLLSHSDGSTTYSAKDIAGGFTLDGVVGWGRWASGTKYDSFSASTYALKDFHYVVGVPTGDLTALGGLQATYQLAGFTLPTSSTGLVGQAPSGTLSANFSTYQASLNMSIPIGGTVLALNDSMMPINSNSGMFYGYTSNVNGFFAGANATHAALTYKINSGIGAIGEVTGAAAFKR